MEDAIVKEPLFLEEDFVRELDRYRRRSLFEVHEMTHKMHRPFYSHNVR